MIKETRLPDGSSHNLANFLLAFGADESKWPDAHPMCPGCGASVVPRLFSHTRNKGLDFQKVRELAEKDPAFRTNAPQYRLGYFEHATNDQISMHCPSLLQQLSISDRMPYIFDLEFDFRVQGRVADILHKPHIRERNDLQLGDLFFNKGPVDCFSRPQARKLLTLPLLEHRPRAFPLLLAVLADPFKYTSKVTSKTSPVRYRTDNDSRNKGKAEYVRFDGEIVEGRMPKYIALCFANNGMQKLLGRSNNPLKQIDFPPMNLDVAHAPSPPRRQAPHTALTRT